jgi:hypothetical protein
MPKQSAFPAGRFWRKAVLRIMSGYGMQTRLLHLHEAEPLTQSASSYQV